VTRCGEWVLEMGSAKEGDWSAGEGSVVVLPVLGTSDAAVPRILRTESEEECCRAVVRCLGDIRNAARWG
jgi:hypothetical protein